MAVVYKDKHHRNPSGRRNKIKWLLSMGKWNEKEMERIYSDVLWENNPKNWVTVLAHAELLRLHAIELDRQVITDLKEYMKRHKGCPPYIEASIATILSYIKECDYSLEVTSGLETS